MKLLPVLLVLGCSMAVVGHARAETVSTRLTPEKPGDHLYSFTVKVERMKDKEMGNYLEVRVTVKAKPGHTHPLPSRTGTLSVYAGKKFVASCEVRATERRGELTYSFRVAAEYGEKTSFAFAETLGPEGEGQGFYYWFYLKDFVEPK